MRKPRTILALPFEDADLPSYLKSRYPESEIEVLRKQDLAGLSITSLLRKVRKNKKDLIVASLRNSTVNRTTSMTELILSASRCHYKIFLDSSGELHHVSRMRIAFLILPRIILGSILGLLVLVLNYFLALYFSSIRAGNDSELSGGNGSGTVLFLRTDLAGELSAGGSVTHIKGIVNGFLKLGYNVVYVADAESSALPEKVRQIVVQPIRLFDFFDELQLSAFNTQLLIKARALLSRYKPAIIYQRLSVFNFAGGVLARRANVPMILEANASEVWAKKNWSRLFFEKTAILSESAALKLASRISIVSDAAREQLEHYKIPADRFIIVPNGVDPEEFRPSIDGADIRARYGFADSIIVGFIGTFTKWHGVETLFDAATIAIRRDRRLRFLMIGDGTLRLELQNKAGDAGVAEYFVFTGLIPHHEAPRLLAACDILVSPHLGFQDGTRFFGSPTKLFEYMAMGKPIIASRLEQIGSIITDGVNGLWMTPGNAEELAEKLTLLAGDSELRIRLGTQARKDCEEKHAWTSNVRRVLDSITLVRHPGPEVVANL